MMSVRFGIDRPRSFLWMRLIWRLLTGCGCRPAAPPWHRCCSGPAWV